MAAIICPRCREPYAGSVVAGDWLTCRSCQHRWMPTVSKVTANEQAELPVLPPAPATPDLPPVSPTARPTKTTLSSQKSIMDSDEYSPNETEYNRAIALTNRHESGDASDNIPSAKAVAQGVDPFDPGMFDKMAREAKSERIKKTGTDRNKQEPTVPARPITCPVCGHGFKSNVPDDASQKCPQCNTSFNLAKGFVSSGISRSSGDVLIGREVRGCLIDRKVGEGGMGAVYHAKQLSLDRSVAIKVLPPELARNRNFITRFEREAKSLAKINHPNILHIYDFGEDAEIGIYFMIIEFVEGRDLGEMLHESYTLGQLEVLDIIRQAALGLEMAANKGVIHRDIKPDNLMLTDEGICKVSDFGLAKANSAERDVTTIGVRVGTPAFMSPEQCDGDDVDFRSDVYNLGCTAFLALTGQLPYDADTPFAIMLKHKNDPVPSPRIYNPNLDSRVEKLVMRMIAKRPSDRCESLRELIEEVENVVVKLAGTSHVLRKSKGPIREMSDLDELEHAKLTSSGPRRIVPPPQAQRVPPPQNDIPVARAASSAAPTGEGAVPDWLKPVENKPRKSSSNLQPAPTPRPAPQAGTTSQPALKDLRTKLAEAKHRNIQEEVEVLRQEAGRLSANGQTEKAAEVYMRAAAITPNPKESQELMAKASWSRRSFGWGKFIRRILIILLLCAGLIAGGFFGIPVGHNILAEQAYAPIQAISAPAARLQATEQFIESYGKLVPYYEDIFKQKYDIIILDQAKKDIEQLKIQLAPPPVIKENKPSPADLEMKKLEAMRDDVSIPWMQVAAEARRIVEQGEAKDRARPILSQAEQQVAAMASDYEAIRKQWAGGHQGEVAKLAAEFREKHTRAGQAAPSALPGQLTIVDNDTQSVPAGIKIVTKALLEANSANTGVIAGEAVLPNGEFTFCRYPHVPVQIEISAPGYRIERLQVPASAEKGVVVVPVTMVPTTVWQTEVVKSPRWMHVNKLPESNTIALVRTPDRYSLINLETGELSKAINRSQIDVPLPSGTKTAYWTDAWDVNGPQLVTGTTDGIAIGIRVSPQELVLANLLHRGPNPMVAFRSKELTFQAGSYASFVISSSDQGLTIQARTKDKDLWSFTGLSGFKRPHMWFADDRVVVIDDNQIYQFDEADGRIIIQKALPGLRTGPIEQIPQTSLYIIPTVQGAVIYNIQANNITPVADNSLTESNGHLIALHNNILVAVRDMRDVSLLTWNTNKFDKKWAVSLPEEVKKITWVSVNDDSVIVADEQSSIHILNSMSGKIIRHIQHTALLQEAPQIFNDKLIVSDRDGNISSYYLPGYKH